MRRRDFLSRIFVGIGLAPLLSTIKPDVSRAQDAVILRSVTEGSFSNNVRFEITPGSMLIDDINEKTYQCVNVTDGETIWISSGTYNLPILIG